MTLHNGIIDDSRMGRNRHGGDLLDEQSHFAISKAT